MNHENSKSSRSCVAIVKIIFDKVGLLQEVKSYNDTMAIDYWNLSRKYNVLNTTAKTAKNDGQIIKEDLK